MVSMLVLHRFRRGNRTPPKLRTGVLSAGQSGGGRLPVEGGLGDSGFEVPWAECCAGGDGIVKSCLWCGSLRFRFAWSLF
ncbi:MAG: hypothetical protein CMJ24_03390 [Phycisphaerae bacterium]|nr:hypothetical protein [Phycisphaerae bacterium]